MVPKSFRDAFPITPNDSAELTYPANSLLIGTAGNLRCVTAAGNTVIIAVPAGLIPLKVTKIFSTNTTASGITGLK